MTYWDPQNAPDVDSEQSDEEYVDMLIRRNPDAYEAAEVDVPPTPVTEAEWADLPIVDLAWFDEDTDRGDR